MRQERLPVMLSAEERKALQTLADNDGLSAAGVLRRLLRQEARQRGLSSVLGAGGPEMVGAYEEASAEPAMAGGSYAGR